MGGPQTAKKNCRPMKLFRFAAGSREVEITELIRVLKKFWRTFGLKVKSLHEFGLSTAKFPNKNKKYILLHRGEYGPPPPVHSRQATVGDIFLLFFDCSRKNFTVMLLVRFPASEGFVENTVGVISEAFL